jgi:UDP-2,4-diacetamido-2,4,6-trideoxy-beta-L-altropyranose hydrolase
LSTHGITAMCVDASPQIGTGHLRRSLALGLRLRDAGSTVHLRVVGKLPAWAHEACHFAAALEVAEGPLEDDEDADATVRFCRRAGADRLVLDRFAVTEGYQRALLDAELRWMQFDGAARVPMWADWVVSMGPAASEAAYAPLRRREQTRFLLGPTYAILREEFVAARSPRRVRAVARELLLTFGGGDDRGACLACLEALRSAPGMHVAVFVSSFNPRVATIEAWLRSHGDMDAELHVDSPDLARRMAGADIALTAAGTTLFEAAAMGLPSLLVQIAENQHGNATVWARLGVAVDLGRLAQLDAERVRRELTALAADPARRQAMAERGQTQVDGRGAQRLSRVLYA